MELPDGTIIPSYLGASGGVAGPDLPDRMGNLCLRTGEIKKIIFPKAKESVSKKFVEYRVVVQSTDSMGRPQVQEYGNCFLSSMFGGVADKYRFTYRAQDPQQLQKSGLGTGSKVAILCINGQTTNALIIGGIRDGVNDKTEDPDDSKGHNLFWEFNGINFSVADDGSASFNFKGPTAVDGTLRKDGDKNNAGTTVKVEKDGTLRAYTIEPGKTDSDIENRITLDHTAGEMRFESSGQIKSTTKKKFDVEATDGLQFNSSKGGFSVGVKDKMLVDSAGVELGDATDKMLLGSKHIEDLGTFLDSLTEDLTTAGIAMTIGSKAMSVPISGPIAAGPEFSIAAQMITQMISAVSQFSGQLQMHLSGKNKLD